MDQDISQFFTRHGYPVPRPEGDIIMRRCGVFAFCHAVNPQDNQRYILLVSPHYSPHIWEFPGGGIDDGEDILTALQREIMEETSLNIPLMDYEPEFKGGWEIAFRAEGYNEFWHYQQNFYACAVPPSWLFADRKENQEDGHSFWYPINSLNRIDTHFFHFKALEKFFPDLIMGQ